MSVTLALIAAVCSCESLRHNGESCLKSRDCESGFCRSGVCVPEPASNPVTSVSATGSGGAGVGGLGGMAPAGGAGGVGGLGGAGGSGGVIGGMGGAAGGQGGN